MSRTKITNVGTLIHLEDGGLMCSLTLSETQQTFWVEVLPNTRDWPGLGKFPEKPKDNQGPRRYSEETQEARRERQAANKAAQEEWKRACANYQSAVHSDPSYVQAASDLLELQKRDPQRLQGVHDFFLEWFQNHYRFAQRPAPRSQTTFWAYRGKIIRLESSDPEIHEDIGGGLFATKAAALVAVKHYVLRREKQYEKVLREVEAFENMEKLETVLREPIPESVRLFVWQRDKGQCVKCGSRERLEFDHIIPVVSGGSSTERNVQLLCESCNRSKGSTI